MLFATGISQKLALAGVSDHRADDRAPADRSSNRQVNRRAKGWGARDRMGGIRYLSPAGASSLAFDVTPQPVYARRSAELLPWVLQVVLAAPVAAFFASFGGEAGNDAYKTFKDWIKELRGGPGCRPRREQPPAPRRRQPSLARRHRARSGLCVFRRRVGAGTVTGCVARTSGRRRLCQASSSSTRWAKRSASAAMVRLGFGPTGPGNTDPSAIERPG
jgi:hypothetical protein